MTTLTKFVAVNLLNKPVTVTLKNGIRLEGRLILLDETNLSVVLQPMTSATLNGVALPQYDAASEVAIRGSAVRHIDVAAHQHLNCDALAQTCAR